MFVLSLLSKSRVLFNTDCLIYCIYINLLPARTLLSTRALIYAWILIPMNIYTNTRPLPQTPRRSPEPSEGLTPNHHHYLDPTWPERDIRKPNGKDLVSLLSKVGASGRPGLQCSTPTPASGRRPDRRSLFLGTLLKWRGINYVINKKTEDAHPRPGRALRP